VTIGLFFAPTCTNEENNSMQNTDGK